MMKFLFYQVHKSGGRAVVNHMERVVMKQLNVHKNARRLPAQRTAS